MKVLSINEEGKISLSMKKALPEDQQRRPARRTDGPRREGGRKEGVRREGTVLPASPVPLPNRGLRALEISSGSPAATTAAPSRK